MLSPKLRSFLDKTGIRPAYRSILLSRAKSELQLCTFITERLKSSDIVVEAGANEGRSTRQLAKLVKQVFAFEPNPLKCDKLYKHLPTNVLATCNGLSDKTTYKDRGRVDSLRLDDFTLFQPTVLIFDMEGNEIKALLGAQKTLKLCRLVFVEVHDRYGMPTEFQCLQILTEAGFKTSKAPVTFDDWIIAEKK
jgi:hypothetical protein